jgi:hypothetical protein
VKDCANLSLCREYEYKVHDLQDRGEKGLPMSYILTIFTASGVATRDLIGPISGIL